MSLAIVMGISIMPVVIWAIMEAKDEIKRNKNKHRK
jgi:hypothetical protein